MFGIACCGSETMNNYEELCCEDVVRSKRQGATYADQCCGNQTLSFQQTCCQGVVHNIADGLCCGSQSYRRDAPNTICCNGTLHTNVPEGSICCGDSFYDSNRQTCCDSVPYDRAIFDSCCEIPPKQYGEETRYSPFNSNTHDCCDKPIRKGSTEKCCYLKVGPALQPTSYNIITQCCAFPFTQIGSWISGRCEFQAVNAKMRDPEIESIQGQVEVEEKEYYEGVEEPEEIQVAQIDDPTTTTTKPPVFVFTIRP
uniref:EB domain-containing protein n=1 Tax=Steinernema glaseri TaxID=37863 RepID=A0A1I8AQK1_9BILA